MGLGDGTAKERGTNGGKGEKRRITNTHQDTKSKPDSEGKDALGTRPGQELSQ